MRSGRGFQGDSRRAHLIQKQAAPACCASTGARAPEPTGLGSGKPWPPAPMLEVFYLFQVSAAPALAVSCSSPMKGPPFGTALISLPIGTGYPLHPAVAPRPWCSRSDRLCPRAGTRVETDWRQLSLGAWRKLPCPREADFSERTCCRWNSGSSRGFYTQTK